MDTSEPELTHELWRSGEVQEKRAQIRRLILDLSEDYKQEKEKKDHEKKIQKDKDKDKEVEKQQQVEGEVIPPKPMETPSITQPAATTRESPNPPAKRRKQLHPTRLVATSPKVIEIE